MPLSNEISSPHSEEINEIITAVPSWILRRGTALIFIVLLSIILLSALINYPDIIRTNLKINSLNAPKTILAKKNGKLTSLLVKEGQWVKKNQPLAFLESIASPIDVLKTLNTLRTFQLKLNKNFKESLNLPTGLNLGELQTSYQTFYTQYLKYQSTQKNGYYINRIIFLEKDLKSISDLKEQIIAQKSLQQLELANIEKEYEAYKQLFEKKVISRSEFSQQENKYFASKYPLQQSEASILSNSSSYLAKQKELLDVKHTIAEEQAKFIQALNQFITESNNWISQHIATASVEGKVNFAGILQENQNVILGQELFIINPGNGSFFGEIQIPQVNMGKIKVGQRTLIKMHSYPYEQYGIIKGHLTYISDVAYRDSVFIGKVNFDKYDQNKGEMKIVLKNGMIADAEIVTEQSSLLDRFFKNFVKILNNVE